MIGGELVVDAVVHPYDLSPRNQNPDAEPQLESVYAAHTLSVDDPNAEFAMTREEFFSDVSYETIASALFLESATDFAVIHALPNLGFANAHVTEPHRAAAYRDRHPGRFGLYATVDTYLTAEAIDELAHQVETLGVDGLKLYPAFFYDGRGEGWRLDGTEFALPLLQAAQEMGIRRVAVHKALWLPPAPREAFAVGDFGGALERFPDIDFFMVHAGTAFRDETAELLRRYPNLHATLESMFAFILVQPDRFADTLAKLVSACGGSDRLLYASGANLMHPRPLIEAFVDYELPEEVLDRYAIPQLTAEDRSAILGANALRTHGRDPDEVRAGIAGDAFDRARPDGLREPWSVLRGHTETVSR